MTASDKCTNLIKNVLLCRSHPHRTFAAGVKGAPPIAPSGPWRGEFDFVPTRPDVSSLVSGTSASLKLEKDLKMSKGQGNGGGWPSTTGNPSGGGRSNGGSGGKEK